MLKLISRLFVSLILIHVFAFACSSKNELKEKQSALYFGVGTQSLMSQDYTGALTALLKADDLDPNNSDILNNLAMAYYFKGEKEIAIKTLKRSLEINENNSDAKVNLASIHYESKNFKEAEALYKEVMKDLTYDKQARNTYNLGILELYNKKDPIAASEYFKKSIDEDSNYCPAYYQLGIIHYQARQYNKALKNLKEATSGTCVQNPGAFYYQALTLIELRRFDDAQLKLEEIQSRFKNSTYANNARIKMREINELEHKYKTEESHASRKMLETPDF